jgi:metal-responsive CopG/Arc/MetJ family transcriptional regulator
MSDKRLRMAKARISIRIEDALRKHLDLVAQSAGKTQSEVVRDALEEYVARNRPVTCYDLFKKAGAIGCYKDGPKDLSTNPKHMDDFGRE